MHAIKGFGMAARLNFHSLGTIKESHGGGIWIGKVG
jgi:hypothetical protein